MERQRKRESNKPSSSSHSGFWPSPLNLSLQAARQRAAAEQSRAKASRAEQCVTRRLFLFPSFFSILPPDARLRLREKRETAASLEESKRRVATAHTSHSLLARLTLQSSQLISSLLSSHRAFFLFDSLRREFVLRVIKEKVKFRKLFVLVPWPCILSPTFQAHN